MQLIGAGKYTISRNADLIASMHHSNIIRTSAKCQLTDEEINCFDIAVSLLKQALIDDGMFPPKEYAIVFFYDEDIISIKVCEPLEQGAHANMIFYPVHHWRRENYAHNDLVVIMLEELCHCFWQIQDEYIVKQKVTSIIQRNHPNLTMDSLFARFHIPPAPLP